MTLGIVTISFNQAQYLSETIASVKLKDSSKLRYVIVDPGSKDGSREIILRNQDKFSAMILEPDKGPADGLNKGFAQCDADIFGYLNSDDRFTPGALDYVLDFFERHPDVDVLMGGVRIINGEGKAAHRRRLSWRFSAQNYLDGTCLPIQQGTFFRRRVWEKTKGFNAENFTCWDTELLIDMLLTGAKIETVYKVFGDFRIHAASITGSHRLNDRYLKDVERLRTKVMRTGVKPTNRILLPVKRAVFRMHPSRRGLEFLTQ